MVSIEPKIARACIVANYKEIWSEIVQSDSLLVVEGKELHYMALEAGFMWRQLAREGKPAPRNMYFDDLESSASRRDIQIDGLLSLDS